MSKPKKIPISMDVTDTNNPRYLALQKWSLMDVYKRENN